VAGVNCAGRDNEFVWGGLAGFGFRFPEPVVSTRLDVGLLLQSARYDAYTKIVRTITPVSWWEPTTETYYYHDIGTAVPLGFYGAVTVNTHNEKWPVNVFGQVAIVRQRLTSFTPHTEIYVAPGIVHTVTDTRMSAYATLFECTPGVFVKLQPNLNLLAGVRLLTEFALSNSTVGFVPSPMMQLDYRF
jgi:hypothetical protein